MDPLDHGPAPFNCMPMLLAQLRQRALEHEIAQHFKAETARLLAEPQERRAA